MKAIELAKRLLEYPNTEVHLKHNGEEVPVELILLKSRPQRLVLETC